jgi:hypothetical protein
MSKFEESRNKWEVDKEGRVPRAEMTNGRIYWDHSRESRANTNVHSLKSISKVSFSASRYLKGPHQPINKSLFFYFTFNTSSVT